MKARFRKKSSKKEPPQLGPDPFRSPPIVPSLELKLPASDFRSSRILPDLGKRFSLLARAEDPAVVKHKLAQLRQARGSAGLTQEEEDLVFRELQQLREDQASRSSPDDGRPTFPTYSAHSPRRSDRDPIDIAGAAVTSPSSSNFFGGLSNEAEYIRKAKRSASNKNLSSAASGGGFKAPVRRRGVSNPPTSPGGGREAPEPPMSAPPLPPSTSFGSLLSDPDSTVEFASLQDLPSPDALPDIVRSDTLSSPLPDRSRRKSLLDSLSPAQVKRISSTLALLEDSLFQPAKPLSDRQSSPGTPKTVSRSPSPQAPSRSQSPCVDRTLSTVVEPPTGSEEGQFDVEALESLSPGQNQLSRKGGPAKRVASSSGYMPGPRPIRNRSLSASSTPAPGGPAPVALPPTSNVCLPTSAASERLSTPSVSDSFSSTKVLPLPSLLSPSERDWATQSAADSDSSHAGPGGPQLLVADQQATYIASPLESSWASHSSPDVDRRSPSSSRRELRGTRDFGRDTFFFGGGSQSTYDDYRPHAASHMSTLVPGSRSQADRTSDEQTPPSQSRADVSLLEEEELLDSHSAQFADRLPSSFDYNHQTGPAPSMSSMALHGHQLSQSSMGSSGPSHQHHSELHISWYSRPESADSDALLPTPIEARSRPSLRSQRSDASLASISGGSSFRSSSGWKSTSTTDFDGVDGRSAEVKSLGGLSLDEGPTDTADMEGLLLTSSGLGRQDIALVHQRLIELHPPLPQEILEAATPRALASELFAGPTSATADASDASPGISPVMQPLNVTPGSPTPWLASIPQPQDCAGVLAASQSAELHHRNQRSRASSILDPDFNGSTDVLNRYLAADSADNSQMSVSQPGEQAGWAQTSASSPTSPSQTDFTSSPQGMADFFSSHAKMLPPRPPVSPATPGTVHDSNFVDDFRAKIDAADNALKKSPSMPRIGASKLSRGKSLKRGVPAISQPQLISSTSIVGATAITITPPPPMSMPERAQTVGHAASKSMSQRFKRLTGRRKSKDNLKEPVWMEDLPPSPTVRTSPRIPPSWPISPPQGAETKTAGDDLFRFPARSPLPSRAATSSPPTSPLDSSGKKTFIGRLRPRKTLDHLATSPEPAIDSRIHPHTAPLVSTRQFSGPPMEGSNQPPTTLLNEPPAILQRTSSFKSGHSHASSVHALFDAASKLGIDAHDVDALLRRSNSASQRSHHTFDSVYSQHGVATPPMTRATSTRSQLAGASISEEPRRAPSNGATPNGVTLPGSSSAQSGLSQSSGVSDLSKSGSVMRRTVILPQENGGLSLQALSPAHPPTSLPPPLLLPSSSTSLPRSPIKARLSEYAPPFPEPASSLPSPLDRRPSLTTKPSMSPSEQSFSRAGHSSANASLFDLYHGQVEDDDEYRDDDREERMSRGVSSSSLDQAGQAVEILEMSNGDVLYSVLQGLRDIDDVEDWDSRSDVASTMDRPPSSVMDEPVKLTFRGHRYDGPDLSRRRSLFKPAKAPRPETKIFYSSSKAVADLIHEISTGHDQGQLQFITNNPSPTSPSYHRSLSINSHHHPPLNAPKRSVSIKRPNPQPSTAYESDPRFSDAPSYTGSEYSVSTRLDRMMTSVLGQAIPADVPSTGGTMSLDVPQPSTSRYTAARF